MAMPLVVIVLGSIEEVFYLIEAFIVVFAEQQDLLIMFSKQPPTKHT
jgi:hypothetical protein